MNFHAPAHAPALGSFTVWVEIGGIRFNLDSITAYRAAGDNATCIWTSGQSAVDGNFLVDVPVSEVEEIVQSATASRIQVQLRGFDAAPSESDNELLDDLMERVLKNVNV